MLPALPALWVAFPASTHRERGSHRMAPNPWSSAPGTGTHSGNRAGLSQLHCPGGAASYPP